MKLLSTALIVGSELLRPVAGIEWDGIGGGCARGMALRSIDQLDMRTGSGHGAYLAEFVNAFPWTAELHVQGPFTDTCQDCQKDIRFATQLAHCWDVHVMADPRYLAVGRSSKDRMSVMQLADWIQYYEPDEAPEVVLSESQQTA